MNIDLMPRSDDDDFIPPKKSSQQSSQPRTLIDMQSATQVFDAEPSLKVRFIGMYY
jgi:hypothetical protein